MGEAKSEQTTQSLSYYSFYLVPLSHSFHSPFLLIKCGFRLSGVSLFYISLSIVFEY